MRRRDFIRVTSGATAATAAGASGVAAAQESPTETPTPEGEGDGETGGEVEVALVDYAFEPGTSEPLVIPPETTVTFVWETGGHNIRVDSQPSDASWEGHENIEDGGFTHEHTFSVVGDYHIICDPHEGLGMIGDITVEEGASLPGEDGGEGGEVEVDPEEMGVAFQAHYVGLATILAIAVSLIFTFFILKYGETPHSGYPGREN